MPADFQQNTRRSTAGVPGPTVKLHVIFNSLCFIYNVCLLIYMYIVFTVSPINLHVALTGS